MTLCLLRADLVRDLLMGSAAPSRCRCGISRFIASSLGPDVLRAQLRLSTVRRRRPIFMLSRPVIVLKCAAREDAPRARPGKLRRSWLQMSSATAGSRERTFELNHNSIFPTCSGHPRRADRARRCVPGAPRREGGAAFGCTYEIENFQSDSSRGSSPLVGILIEWPRAANERLGTALKGVWPPCSGGHVPGRSLAVSCPSGRADDGLSRLSATTSGEGLPRNQLRGRRLANLAKLRDASPLTDPFSFGLRGHAREEERPLVVAVVRQLGEGQRVPRLVQAPGRPVHDADHEAQVALLSRHLRCDRPQTKPAAYGSLLFS